jgi:hypothetical protein
MIKMSQQKEAKDIKLKQKEEKEEKEEEEKVINEDETLNSTQTLTPSSASTISIASSLSLNNRILNEQSPVSLSPSPSYSNDSHSHSSSRLSPVMVITLSSNDDSTKDESKQDDNLDNKSDKLTNKSDDFNNNPVETESLELKSSQKEEKVESNLNIQTNEDNKQDLTTNTESDSEDESEIEDEPPLLLIQVDESTLEETNTIETNNKNKFENDSKEDHLNFSKKIKKIDDDEAVDAEEADDANILLSKSANINHLSSEPVRKFQSSFSNMNQMNTDRYEAMQPRLKKFLTLYQKSAQNSLNGPTQHDIIDSSLNNTISNNKDSELNTSLLQKVAICDNTPKENEHTINKNDFNESLSIIANVAAAASAAAATAAATSALNKPKKHENDSNNHHHHHHKNHKHNHHHHHHHHHHKKLKNTANGTLSSSNNDLRTAHLHSHSNSNSSSSPSSTSSSSSSTTSTSSSRSISQPNQQKPVTVKSQQTNQQITSSYLKCMQTDTQTSPLMETKLHNESISCFIVGGEKRLCLHDILNSILKDFSVQQINSACQKLHIACLESSMKQLDILKRNHLLPPGAPNCGLLTQTNAERLCAFLMDSTLSKSPDTNDKFHVTTTTPTKTSKNNLKVSHECFGKTYGHLNVGLYTHEDAACIECDICRRMYSPRNFVCHSHKYESHTRHWGFDSANWRIYLRLVNASTYAANIAAVAELANSQNDKTSGGVLTDLKITNKDNIAANVTAKQAAESCAMLEEFEMFKQKFMEPNQMKPTCAILPMIAASTQHSSLKRKSEMEASEHRIRNITSPNNKSSPFKRIDVKNNHHISHSPLKQQQKLNNPVELNDIKSMMKSINNSEHKLLNGILSKPITDQQQNR